MDCFDLAKILARKLRTDGIEMTPLEVLQYFRDQFQPYRKDIEQCLIRCIEDDLCYAVTLDKIIEKETVSD